MTMSRKGLIRTHFGVEELEKKIPLAGNVAVYLDNTDLIIEGDNKANCAEFDMFDNFALRGCRAAGHPTRVNGTRDAVSFKASTEVTIRFLLKSGNDIVRVGTNSVSVHLSEDLEIDTGRGDDEVEIVGDVFVDNDLVIKTRQGNDHIAIALTTNGVNGSTVLQTDEGDDEIIVQGKTNLDGELEIDTRAGRDVVRIGVLATDDIDISGVAHIETHGGDDTLSVCSSTFRSLFRAEGSRGVDIFASRSNFSVPPDVTGFELFPAACPVISGVNKSR